MVNIIYLQIKFFIEITEINSENVNDTSLFRLAMVTANAQIN